MMHWIFVDHDHTSATAAIQRQYVAISQLMSISRVHWPLDKLLFPMLCGRTAKDSMLLLAQGIQVPAPQNG